MNQQSFSLDIYHASAGTGKTSKLLETIEGWIQAGVPIDKIALVTFTKKGAEVAKRRLSDKFNIPISRLKNVRTIHSLAFRGINAVRERVMDRVQYADFCLQTGYTGHDVGLDKQCNMEESVDWSSAKGIPLLSLEQLYRTNRKYFEKLSDAIDIDNKALIDFMALYTKYKRTYGYYDYTDMLEMYLKQGLVEDVDIACLDEMQDSTTLQWQVVFQAFKNAKHMYIVGDDKQSVFSYSGADIEPLLNLKGCHHTLDVSYRVPSNILSFVDKQIVDVMGHKYATYCEAAHMGGKVEYLTAMEDFAQHYNRNKTYFFLTRNRYYYKVFTDWCKSAGLPYMLKGEPCFNEKELFDFRMGRPMDYWSKEKFEFAMACRDNGLLYSKPNIDISTIHGVKGDEADCVVLLGDMTKAPYVHLDIDPDSEHRVFYVAATRARETLYILSPQSNRYYPYLYA